MYHFLLNSSEKDSIWHYSSPYEQEKHIRENINQYIGTNTLSYQNYKEDPKEALFTEWKETNTFVNETQTMWSLMEGKEGNHTIWQATNGKGYMEWEGAVTLIFINPVCVPICDSFINGVYIYFYFFLLCIPFHNTQYLTATTHRWRVIKAGFYLKICPYISDPYNQPGNISTW